jgi:uncharacterized protein with HEPN domain
MQHNDRDCSYFFDMMECCHDILNFTSEISPEQFEGDKMRRLATERQLETLGEAANHISIETQQIHPNIDWPKIIGLRNKLAHDYGEILAQRVFLIAKQNIPDLYRIIQEILTNNCQAYSLQALGK